MESLDPVSSSAATNRAASGVAVTAGAAGVGAVQLVGLATAVHAVVVRPLGEIVTDGAVSGEVHVGRGGMVCNTLAVASALGVRTGGVVVSGDDVAGAAMRRIVEDEGVLASFVPAARTPVTVTIAAGGTRSSIMGVDGEREPDVSAGAVEAAWDVLAPRPVWAYLTLPALDSPAGRRFVELARRAGAHVAVTLSSTGHVTQRGATVGGLVDGIDVVFANAAEADAFASMGGRAALLLATDGERGATILQHGEPVAHVPVPHGALGDVVDTTGAGDAFAAGVLSVLTPRAGLAEVAAAVAVGHRAAAIMISCLGAAAGTRERSALRELGRAHA